MSQLVGNNPAVPDLYGPTEFGPHPVGFSSQSVLDTSRTFTLSETAGGVPGRPLHIAIWYPAEKPGKPMTYASYVALIGSAIPNRSQSLAWSKQAFRKSLLGMDHEFSASWLDAFLNQPVRASRDAPQTQGPFPTVFYYAGGKIHPNATFCEYLASHGFVVVSLQGPGTYTRASRGSDPHRPEVMLRDLEFRMGYMSKHWPNANPNRIAVISFSFSATVGVLAAMKHPRIKAFIALDPYEMYVRGKGVFEASAHFQAPDFQIPMLTLYSSQRWDQLPKKFLPKLAYADRTVIHVSAFKHIDFLTTGRCYVAGQTPEKMAKLAGANAAMRLFLQVHLAGNMVDKQNLSAQLAALGPNQAFSITHHPGKPVAAHSANLAARIALGEDLSFVSQELAKAKGKASEAPLYRENFMNWMGSQALRDERYEMALLLYQWSTEAYPNSANAHAGLGDYYAARGQRQDALFAYQRALEIQPQHWRATNGMRRLNKP